MLERSWTAIKAAVDGKDKSCWKDHEQLSKRLIAAIEQKGAAADHGSGSTTKAILNVVEDWGKAVEDM